MRHPEESITIPAKCLKPNPLAESEESNKMSQLPNLPPILILDKPPPL